MSTESSPQMVNLEVSSRRSRVGQASLFKFNESFLIMFLLNKIPIDLFQNLLQKSNEVNFLFFF